MSEKPFLDPQGAFWSELEANPLWQQFWASQKVEEMIVATRNQLLRASGHTPETLGRLRGRLEVLEKIPTMVRTLAENERGAMRKGTENSRIVGLAKPATAQEAETQKKEMLTWLKRRKTI